jgi:hypothetical protein
MSGSTWNSVCRSSVASLVWATLLFGLPGLVPAADEEECYRCHGLEGFAVLKDGTAKALALSPEYFESSVHSLLNCRECHSDIAALPHPGASVEISCGQACHQRDRAGDLYSHESLFWEFTKSLHGESSGRKITCMTCHPADSFAELVRRDLELEVRQCASCHGDSGHVQEYFRGFHYRSMTQGDRRSPSCPDCHSAHRVLPLDSAESAVGRERLAVTCGTGAVGSSPAGRCHGDLSEETVQGADMTPLVLPGEKLGPMGWAFSLLYWGLLAGLAARAATGLKRRR